MCCNTAAQVIAKTWETVDEVYTKYGAYVEVGAAATGQAEIIAAMKALKTANKLGKATAEAIKIWNKLASNSWATIGPRQLTIGKSQDGTLVGPTTRCFISPTPCESGSVKVALSETDGKSETDICICRIGPDEKESKLASFSWNDSQDEKKKKQKFEGTFSGVAGALLVVTLKSRSLTNSLSYKLKVSAAA